MCFKLGPCLSTLLNQELCESYADWYGNNCLVKTLQQEQISFPPLGPHILYTEKEKVISRGGDCYLFLVKNGPNCCYVKDINHSVAYLQNW